MILRGWLDMRSELRSLGFADGFQWLDGSFVEDVETGLQRPPNDIDLVTFAISPAGLAAGDVEALAIANPHVFSQAGARERFRCDAYMVRLDGAPQKLVKRATYYLSLFSHRRRDNLWKGLLEVPLHGNDDQATALLHTLNAGDQDAAAA